MILTRVAGVPDLIHGPAVCFLLYSYAHPSFSTTNGAVTFLDQAI